MQLKIFNLITKAKNIIQDYSLKAEVNIPGIKIIRLTIKRYQDCNGNFYAAAITYFSILALMPLLMLVFSVFSFIFQSNSDWINYIYDNLPRTMSQDFKEQIINMINRALAAKTTVGLFGIILAIWSGLVYIANLRTGLSAMWKIKPPKRNLFAGKVSDLLILLGLLALVALLIFIGAARQTVLINHLIKYAELSNPLLNKIVIKIISWLISIVLFFIMFTWMLYALPLVPVSFQTAIKAGILTTFIFQIFLVLAVYYLKSITSSLAGATFGSIIGIMVFLYIISRILLFIAAWEAETLQHSFKP